MKFKTIKSLYPLLFDTHLTWHNNFTFNYIKYSNILIINLKAVKSMFLLIRFSNKLHIYIKVANKVVLKIFKMDSV